MHKLLERQLRKHVPQGAPPCEGYARLLAAVDEAYVQADEARLYAERSLELMSSELLERNEQLQRDLLEIKRLELELRQADKLRAVGQLAAGVAHEINTPIQFVGDSLAFLRQGFREFLRLLDSARGLLECLGANGDPLPALDRVIAASAEIDGDYLLAEFPVAIDRACEGVEHVAQIVAALKDFGRPDQRARTFSDLNRGLRNTLTVAQSEIRRFADVDLQLGELPNVPCFPGDLNQVFLNLLINAAHAIEQRFYGSSTRGAITLKTWADATSAFIEVTDNGAGIPAGDKARIFEPFFTTKPVGKGTGQGLAISHSIVTDKHGGTLTFESEAGLGTRFLIRLPLEVPEVLSIRGGGTSGFELEAPDVSVAQ